MIKSLVYGFGVNDLGYRTDEREFFYVDGKRRSKTLWVCPFYRVWRDMLARSSEFSNKYRQPTYTECQTHLDWKYASVFKGWMEKQDWEGNYLDKDILVIGNKIYGPDTCVFVSREVNNFVTDRANHRGQWPIGVIKEDCKEKFRAVCSKNGKRVHLGYFHTPEETHQAWLDFKLELAYDLASRQKDQRVANALVYRYENYKELFGQSKTVAD